MTHRGEFVAKHFGKDKVLPRPNGLILSGGTVPKEISVSNEISDFNFKTAVMESSTHPCSNMREYESSQLSKCTPYIILPDFKVVVHLIFFYLPLILLFYFFLLPNQLPISKSKIHFFSNCGINIHSKNVPNIVWLLF